MIIKIKNIFNNILLYYHEIYNFESKYNIRKTFYQSGSIRSMFNSENNLINGLYKEFHINSNKIKAECKYINGNKNGTYKSWFPNSQLRIECNFINGRKTGLYKKWFNNGQLKRECYFINDIKCGPYKEWYYNGQIKIDCNYENNKLDGSYKKWFDNGQIKIDCNYENNKLDGSYKKWFDNGQIKIISNINYSTCMKDKCVIINEYKQWYLCDGYNNCASNIESNLELQINYKSNSDKCSCYTYHDINNKTNCIYEQYNYVDMKILDNLLNELYEENDKKIYHSSVFPYYEII